MLQLIAWKLGVHVDRTPKCHCELAGEGIEYAWACSKNKYRSLLLENKRGKENFMRSVRMCISRDILTREHAQKFARRARRYIMGYHMLHQMQQNDVHGNEMASSGKDLAIVPIKLEQMVKNFKTHRCALDFDYSCCKEVFQEAASASWDSPFQFIVYIIIIIIIIIVKNHCRIDIVVVVDIVERSQN